MRKIFARAPLRLGLAGGGTDLPEYADKYGGIVLSTTIDRYAHVIIEPNSDKALRFSAPDVGIEESFPEEWSYAKRLALNGARLVLNAGVMRRFFEMGMGWRNLTVTSFVDAPAGSGLGSSSALVVALIKAFSVYTQTELSNQNIADLACSIEREDLNLLGGRQDQFSAAFGGTNLFRFLRGVTTVEEQYLNQSIARTLELSLVACFTGLSRESAHIIAEKNEKILAHSPATLTLMQNLKTDAIRMREALLKGYMSDLATILNSGWRRKKELAPSVSNERIERLLVVAMEAGALGGKVSGAGGGGFMMFIVPPERRCIVIKALKDAGADASPLHLTTNGVEAWETTV